VVKTPEHGALEAPSLPPREASESRWRGDRPIIFPPFEGTSTPIKHFGEKGKADLAAWRLQDPGVPTRALRIILRSAKYVVYRLST